MSQTQFQKEVVRQEMHDSSNQKKKSLLSDIPVNRIILYAFFIGVLPLFLSFFFVYHIISQAQDAQRNIEYSQEQILIALQGQVSNRQVIHQFQVKDPFYLTKVVELYQPLEREREVLKQLQSYGNFPDTGVQERRYKHISQGENTFHFVESAATVTPLLKETLETQNRPVELDGKDLSKVLAVIEESQGRLEELTRPQLLVLDGSLERRRGYDQEVWVLSLKLLKRIYTSPTYIKNHISLSEKEMPLNLDHPL